MTITELFNHWYKQHGHWIYESREAALEMWKTNGLDGLPDYVIADIETKIAARNFLDGM